MAVGVLPRYVVVAMALAALIAPVDGQHRAIVHAAAPQIGEAVQQTRSARTFSGLGNFRLRHLQLTSILHQKQKRGSG